MNAGIIMQRVLRVLDSTDMRSFGSSHELAEAITAAILDLPEQYWACAPEAPIEEALRLANADKASILKRIDTEIASAEALSPAGELNALLKAGRLGALHMLKETFIGAGWIDPREPSVR